MTLAARFGPPLALMGLIYFLSAQPHLTTGLGVWDFILRKGAHMTEYGLLWFLWYRALGHRRTWAAIAISVAYAATDELHQTHVAGRHGTPVDVLIDSVGIAIAIAVSARAARGPLLRRRRAGTPGR